VGEEPQERASSDSNTEESAGVFHVTPFIRLKTAIELQHVKLSRNDIKHLENSSYRSKVYIRSIV
jgi:hypothetical protein